MAKENLKTALNLDLSDLSLVIDCANGANYSIAPQVFSELGSKVIELSTSPDGININDECGSTNPENIKKVVLENKADLGIAFDGDGDRLLFIDKEGKELDGDDLLYILVSANQLRDSSETYQGIVGTLMSNKSLELFINKQGIDFYRTDVGDKYVLRELIKRNLILGGEPSGHIICLDSTTTGDAIITSLKVLEATRELNFDLSKALLDFKKLPQELISLKVKDPQRVIMDSRIRSEVSKLENKLGKEGRVLLRPSGTEDLIRVMVEANSETLAKDLASELAQFIQQAA